MSEKTFQASHGGKQAPVVLATQETEAEGPQQNKTLAKTLCHHPPPP